MLPFLWGQPRAQGSCDLLCDVSLDGEDVRGRQLSVIDLSPSMLVALRVDELHVDSHPVSGSLNTAFQYIGDPQLVGDLPDMLLRVFVPHHGGAGYRLEAGDLVEMRENVVMDAVDEWLGLLVTAEVSEGEHRDRRDTTARFGARLADHEPAGGHDPPRRQRTHEDRRRVTPGPKMAGASISTTFVRLLRVSRGLRHNRQQQDDQQPDNQEQERSREQPVRQAKLLPEQSDRLQDAPGDPQVDDQHLPQGSLVNLEDQPLQTGHLHDRGKRKSTV